MNIVLSSWIHMALDATNVTRAINFLKQQYSTPASEEVTSFQLYDPRVTTIRMDQDSEPITSITLEFLDQSRAKIDPEDMLINLEIR